MDDAPHPRSLTEVHASLRSLLPQTSEPPYIDDSVFDSVASLLQKNPKTEPWSTRPRTFAILWLLRWIDDEHKAQPFLDESAGDSLIPYDRVYFPAPLQADDDLWLAFSQIQPCVLSYPSVIDQIASRESVESHEHFDDLNAHLVNKGLLGSRGVTQVTKIWHRRSQRYFVKKSIWRGKNATKQRESWEEFQRELEALKRLDHRHFVKCVGSYTDRTTFSLLMLPVCDSDLDQLLDPSNAPSITEEQKQWLRHSFGCLARSVLYLHREIHIRHKDIKPGNILLLDGRIYLCDFGIAHSFSGEDGGTTDGPAIGYTRRYCAPEVINFEKRNESSDVWSLGCVFLEMVTVIKGKTIHDMDEFLRRQGAESRDLWNSVEQIQQWITHLRDDSADDAPLDWIEMMIREAPEQRAPAAEIVSLINEHGAADNEYTFIGACCDPTASHATSPTVRQTPFARSLVRRTSPRKPSVSPSQNAPRTRSNDRRSDSVVDAQFSPPFKSLNDPWISSTKTRMSSYDSHNLSVRSPPSFQLGPRSTMSDPPSDGSDLGSFRLSDSSSHEPENAALLFTSLLASFDVLEGETPTGLRMDQIEQFNVQLFEDASEDVWKQTRRLVIEQPETGTNGSTRTTIWLPLADVHHFVDVDEVKLRWSDCNHVGMRKPGDYGTKYSRVYNPNRPNHCVRMKFLNTSDADLFVQSIRSLNERMKSVRPCAYVKLSEDYQTGVQVYNILLRADESKAASMYYRAMLHLDYDEDQFVSRLYLAWKELDLKWGPAEVPGKYELTISKLRRPFYISDAVDMPNLDKEGHYQLTDLKWASMTFDFSVDSLKTHKGAILLQPPQKVVSLLEGLTGWKLLRFTTQSFLTQTKKFPHHDHKLGNAEIMIWKRFSGHRLRGQVTFRLQKDTNTPWITGTVPDDDVISSSSGTHAKTKLFKVVRGSLLNIIDMKAVNPSEHRSKSGSPLSPQPESTKSETSEYEIKFPDEHGRSAFVRFMEDLVRDVKIDVERSHSISSRLSKPRTISVA